MRDLFVLAGRQYGLFTLDQAHALDLSNEELAGMRGSGMITRKAPGVYAVTGSMPTWRQRVMEATLWLPGSLASHRTAAALWDLDAFPPRQVEVVVERWQRRHRPPGVLVHETKDLVSGDIDERYGIPCTSLVRTLVDLPAVAPEFRCGEALDQATRHDDPPIDLIRMRHLEVARRGRNGTVKLRALLDERGDNRQKVDSGFERSALRLINRAGLPRPVTQFQVRDGGFVCYLDVAWPDRMVAMECDSVAHHSSVAAMTRDRERRRRLLGLGWTVLEFTFQDVTRRPWIVARDLDHHLGQAPAHPTALPAERVLA